jgi:hypothetical protein
VEIPVMQTRNALLPALFGVLLGVTAVRGDPAGSPDNPRIQLSIPSVAAEPGEEVPLEIRGTFDLPLSAFTLEFRLPEGIADFVRTDIQGTAAAHALPRSVIFRTGILAPGRSTEAWVTGVCLEDGSPRIRAVLPGEDVLLVKAVLRIRPEAQVGTYPLEILRRHATAIPPEGPSAVDAAIEMEEGSSVTVTPPLRPRPVADLSCRTAGSDVVLCWGLTETWDALRVERNGALLAILPGDPTEFVDRPSPGLVAYSVVAVRDARESFVSRCEVLVDIPRPAPVLELSCSIVEDAVHLSWANGAAYDSVHVSRNGRHLATLSGSSRSWIDPVAPSLLSIYTVEGEQGEVRSLASQCRLNEFSETFVLRAEDVRARPGQQGLPMRIFLTNPEPIQGLQLALRLDPALGRIRDLSLNGTVTAALGYEFFAVNEHPDGVLVAGLVVSYTSESVYLPLADWHLATAVMDVPPHAPEGLATVEFVNRPKDEELGIPPAANVITALPGSSRYPEIQPGVLLLGTSPVPEVEGARAEESPEAKSGGAGKAGGPPPGSILLQWRNPVAYGGIRVERDGKTLVVLPGDSTHLIDPDPGPGRHHYRIVASQGDLESFPASVSPVPRGVAGTFLRGDANLDGSADLTDAITMVLYILEGGPPLACLDAVDSDDDGQVELDDAISLLGYLFASGAPLPPPGPDTAWFDPTEDELTCGSTGTGK